MLFQVGVGQFQQAFRILQQWGLLDVILPFALIFTIVYSAIKNFAPDGTPFKSDKVAAVIALSITLLMVVPHVVSPSPNDMVSIINRALPEIGLVFVGIVLVLIMTGIIKPTAGSWIQQYVQPVIPYAGILIILIIFYRALFPYQAPYWPNWLNFLSDPALQALLIVLLIFGLVVMLVVGKSGGGGGAAGATGRGGGVPPP